MRKLTQQEVIKRLQNLNTGITLIGEYKGTGKTHTFKCKNNHTWKALADSILNKKTECPHCNTNKLTTNDVIERLKRLNTGITLIGEYKGMHKKHTFKCKKNHTWESTCNSVLNMKSGCPYCNKRFYPKTNTLYDEFDDCYINEIEDNEKYVKELQSTYLNNNILE